MSIKNDLLGGTNWTGEEVVNAVDLNDTFDALFSSSPVGTILFWLKDLTSVPDLNNYWVECNGQVLNDPNSVLTGQTIPNLNGEFRFLCGNTTSGGTGGTNQTTLTHNIVTYDLYNYDLGGDEKTADHVFENRPLYYTGLWIIKVK